MWKRERERERRWQSKLERQKGIRRRGRMKRNLFAFGLGLHKGMNVHFNLAAVPSSYEEFKQRLF